MRLTRGEIWFTRFGEPVGREQGFNRPAMIISNDSLNQSKLGLIFVLPLTTRERGYPTHIRIGRNGTGLERMSWAMTEQVRAVSPARFDFFIGYAPDEVVTEAITALDRML
ncbi:type II toxin-antitoxin system PemK/MazF family toxin [Nonomuraea jabiensis]|uniref:type II toxin-antitoxin system PemK/MazF family toxin n=1 Tax=Nonomuraea jabiensis TaxID=882448 RepID=UPI00341C9C0A